MTPKPVSVRHRRHLLIQLFYRYLLLNKDENYISQDLLDETQAVLDKTTFAQAKAINQNMTQLVEIIKAHLNQDWPWSRLPFLIQAILLVGVYEIKETKTSNAVTINAMTQITKDYGLMEHYRFVNALLDKVSKL